MNIRQLEIFRAVMSEGTITAAANLLAISQPAASKMLRHLEDQIGYALFEKIGNRLQPTSEAQTLFEETDKLFRELASLKDIAKRVEQRKVGILRLGAALPVVHSFLPKVIKQFMADHSDVRVQLHSLPASNIADALRAGQVDLGLTLSRIAAPTVRTEILCPVSIVALLPADHPLANKDAVTADDLSEEVLISYGSEAEIAPDLDAFFEARGLERQVHVQVASSIAAAPFVAAGVGVALVDGLADMPDCVIKRPLMPGISVQVMASTDAARPINRLVEPLLELLREMASNPEA